MKTRIILVFATIFLALVGQAADAAGLSTSLTASQSSAPVGSHVTLTFREYMGGTGYSGYEVTFNKSGATSVLSSNGGTTDSGGYVTTTLTGSAVGNVTVTAYQSSSESKTPYPVGQVTVNFVTPTAPAPSPKVASNVKAAPNSATPPTAPTPPPAAPTVPTLGATSFEDGDTTIAGDKHFQLDAGSPLTLKGVTVPGGVVRLTIHSTPRTATVTADAIGRWKYVISGLESGSHKIEATVTDPATKLTSPSVLLAQFTIARPIKANTHHAAVRSNRSTILWLVGGLSALILFGTIVVLKLWSAHKAKALPALGVTSRAPLVSLSTSSDSSSAVAPLAETPQPPTPRNSFGAK